MFLRPSDPPGPVCPASPLVELVDTAAVIETPVTNGGERWGPERATCGPAWLRLEPTNTGKTAATEAVAVVAQVCCPINLMVPAKVPFV